MEHKCVQSDTKCVLCGFTFVWINVHSPSSVRFKLDNFLFSMQFWLIDSQEFSVLHRSLFCVIAPSYQITMKIPSPISCGQHPLLIKMLFWCNMYQNDGYSAIMCLFSESRQNCSNPNKVKVNLKSMWLIQIKKWFNSH